MNNILELSNLRIDIDSRDISNLDGNTISLRPLSFDVLNHLIKNIGKCITRDELFSTCWSGVIVSDQALTNVISNIRHTLTRLKAVGVEVKTVTKIGYKLCIEGNQKVMFQSQPTPIETSPKDKPTHVPLSSPESLDLYSQHNVEKLSQTREIERNKLKNIRFILNQFLASRLTSCMLFCLLAIGIIIHLNSRSDTDFGLQDTSNYRKLINGEQTLFVDDRSSANVALAIIERAMLTESINQNTCGMTYLLRIYNSKKKNRHLNLSAFAFDKKHDDNSNYTHFSVTHDNLVPIVNDLIGKANSLCES